MPVIPVCDSCYPKTRVTPCQSCQEEDEKFWKYTNSLQRRSGNRDGSKYYPEIQRLSYDLIRYLRMNDAKGEHVNQGNWNTTYFIENMKKKDFEFLTLQMMRRTTSDRLFGMVRHNLGDNPTSHLVHHFPPAAPGEPQWVDAKDVNRYLKRKVPFMVGFGFLMGAISGLGAFFFFN